MSIDSTLRSGQDTGMGREHELLQKADQLVDGGDYRGAISFLEEAGRFDDPELARRLEAFAFGPMPRWSGPSRMIIGHPITMADSTVKPASPIYRRPSSM